VQGEKYSAEGACREISTVQKVRAGREVQFTAARVLREVHCRGCVQGEKYNSPLHVYREKYNARVNVQRGKYGAGVNVLGEKYSARVHVQRTEVQNTRAGEVINSFNSGGMEQD
jgi:hypothetical protein